MKSRSIIYFNPAKNANRTTLQMSGTLAHETYHLMNDWEGASQMEEYIAYSVGYAASNKIISEAANPIVENFFRQAGWE